jgi:hypothetical protein
VVVVVLLGSGPTELQGGLPAAARHVLDTSYPGWQFARVRAELARILPSGVSAAWVAGDFDGGGRQDYAVQIVAPQAPADSAQRIVLLLRHGRGYTANLVEARPRADNVYLARSPEGGKIVDLEARDDSPGADPRSGVIVLPHDGLTILYGEEAGSTCYFAARRLRCVLTGD